VWGRVNGPLASRYIAASYRKGMAGARRLGEKKKQRKRKGEKGKSSRSPKRTRDAKSRVSFWGGSRPVAGDGDRL